MRFSRAVALALVGAVPVLITVSARAASECPASGTMPNWGVNGSGYFNVAAGGTCLFPIRMEGVVRSSSIAQKPAHGTLKRINISTYEFTAKAGYKGPDAFAVKATGKGPKSSGTSVITMNATIQ
jgi:hypothetical protein